MSSVYGAMLEYVLLFTSKQKQVALSCIIMQLDVLWQNSCYAHTYYNMHVVVSVSYICDAVQ